MNNPTFDGYIPKIIHFTYNLNIMSILFKIIKYATCHSIIGLINLVLHLSNYFKIKTLISLFPPASPSLFLFSPNNDNNHHYHRRRRQCSPTNCLSSLSNSIFLFIFLIFSPSHPHPLFSQNHHNNHLPPKFLLLNPLISPPPLTHTIITSLPTFHHL